MRHIQWITSVALLASVALSGCREDELAANSSGASSADRAYVSKITIPPGTAVDVSLATTISSETAHVGDSWSGTVQSPVVVHERMLISSGATVAGRVSGALPAHRGSRALLDLEMTSASVDGHTIHVRGATAAVIAGSTRARNLGAIAGSAAAGALIGRAVTGTGRGAAIGGILGGGAATAVVAESDGYQVVLKEGTTLTFSTEEAVAMRP